MSDPQQPYRPYEERGSDNPANPYGPTDPYGTPDPYGPQPSYGRTPQPYPGYGSAAPDHPQATLILVFGIAGFFVGFLAPVAWIMGSRALKEIRATGVHPRNEQQIVIGRILGIVGTVLIVLGVLLFLLLLVVAGVAAGGY